MNFLGELPRDLGRYVEGARIAGRTLLSLDTNPVPREWEHITKIDPEDEKKLPLLYPLYLQHTSAISVGGSRDVTPENTEATFRLLNPIAVPAFHEPSDPQHVTEFARDSAEFLAIPEVLNGDVESLIGKLGEGIEHIRDTLVPEMLSSKLPVWLPSFVTDRLAEFATSWQLADAVFEAYIIQNLDSAAAREAGVTEDDLLSPQDAKRRAMAAERHLDSEVIYLEYSGTFGDEEGASILSAISDGVSWSRIWYGGGIGDGEQSRKMLDAGADAVVVGNVFHEVANEEAELLDRAVEELDDFSRASIRDWISSAVDLEATYAVRYLDTIPSVTNPEHTAREYLTTTIHLWGELVAEADEIGADATDGVDREAVIRDHLERDLLPAQAALNSVVEDELSTFATLYADAVVGVTGNETPDSTAAHLSVFQG